MGIADNVLIMLVMKWSKTDVASLTIPTNG